MDKRVKIGSIALMCVVVLVGGILFWVNTTKVDEQAISNFGADYLQTVLTTKTDEKTRKIRKEKLEDMLDIDENGKELSIAMGNHGSDVVTKTKIYSIEEIEKNHYEVVVTLNRIRNGKEAIVTYSTVVSTNNGKAPYKISDGFKYAKQYGDTKY